MGRSELAIVIPARNEENHKEGNLSLKKYGDILVIDDHSSDKSQKF